MRDHKRIIDILPFLLLGMAFAPNAHAYLDPGTGSFLLQMLIAGALGAVLYVKMFWTRTKIFFLGLFASGRNKTVDKSDTELEETSK